MQTVRWLPSAGVSAGNRADRVDLCVPRAPDARLRSRPQPESAELRTGCDQNGRFRCDASEGEQLVFLIMPLLMNL